MHSDTILSLLFVLVLAMVIVFARKAINWFKFW